MINYGDNCSCLNYGYARVQMVRVDEWFAHGVKSGSSALSRPMSLGIEGPNMSRSRIPTRGRRCGLAAFCARNANANARLTVIEIITVSEASSTLCQRAKRLRTSHCAFPYAALSTCYCDDMLYVWDSPLGWNASAGNGWRWWVITVRQALRYIVRIKSKCILFLGSQVDFHVAAKS